MPASGHSPVLVFDGIIYADMTGMTLCLHRIPAQRASGCHSVAGAHKDRVCSMPEMVCTSIRPALRRARVTIRRGWKTQAGGGEGFTRGLKCGDREAEGET